MALSKEAKIARRKVCDDLAAELYIKRKAVDVSGTSTRKALYGMNKAFLAQSKHIYPWLTRDLLENALRRIKKLNMTSNINELVNPPTLIPRNQLIADDPDSDIDKDDAEKTTSGEAEKANLLHKDKAGRPKGTTKKATINRTNDFIIAKNKITQRYAEVRNQ